MVEYCYNKGANFKIIYSNKVTPLHIAARHQTNSWLTKYIISACVNVNAADEYLNTPLHVCARNTNEEIAEILIKSKAKIDVVNSKGQTPLHNAA